jgi:hypothetical protein
MLSPVIFRPIVINTSRFTRSAENEEANMMAIIPWKPTAHALAIKLYAAFVDRQKSMVQESESAQAQQKQSSYEPDISTGPTFEFETTDLSPTENQEPVRPKKALVQSPSTPLVETTARRSLRQKKGKMGFKGTKDGIPHTWLEKNPTKRQKVTAVQINSETGKVGPIQTDILRSWGLECGVDPGDLTDEVLTQAPSDNHL